MKFKLYYYPPQSSNLGVLSPFEKQLRVRNVLLLSPCRKLTHLSLFHTGLDNLKKGLCLSHSIFTFSPGELHIAIWLPKPLERESEAWEVVLCIKKPYFFPQLVFKKATTK